MNSTSQRKNNGKILNKTFFKFTFAVFILCSFFSLSSFNAISDDADSSFIIPGIEVVKSVTPSSGTPLTEVTFTITVTNVGGCDLDPVVVEDELPSGLSYISDDSGGVIGPDGIITWDLGALQSYSPPVVIILVAMIEDDASGVLQNLVSAIGTTPSGDEVDDDDTAEVTVLCSNLEIIKSVKRNCDGEYNDEGIIIDLNEGHQYNWCTFRINVTNTNDAPLNVTVKDVLPDGLINGDHYKPREPDYIDGNELYWYFDGVADDFIQPNETISIELRADMGECDVEYVNYAYVTRYLDSGIPITECDDAAVMWINCPSQYLDINQSIYDRGFPIRYTCDGDWSAAQSFKPTCNVLTYCELYLGKFGNPEYDLNVELRLDHPRGILLDSVILNPDDFPNSCTWFEIDFEDQIVSEDSDYLVVCTPSYASSMVTTSFGYEWSYAYGNHYDDGAFWFTRDGGVVWRDLPGMYEFAFRIYGYD